MAELAKPVKKNILTFNAMKQHGETIAWITAYDFPLSRAAERAGVDLILIGDSGGMVQLGYETTNPVTMDEMITLSKSVRRGAQQTFLVGDMPQGSYEVSEQDAIVNALRFIKEAGCDAVKCEGGKRMGKSITAMVNAGILVVGHLGLTPQSTGSFGGYRVQAKTRASFDALMEDALYLEELGICALLLEAMPAASAEQVARRLRIPVFGIGAGGNVDGQLIIMHDLLGLYPTFRPYFAKGYVPDVVSSFQSFLTSTPDIRQMGRDERKDGLLFLAELAIGKYVEEVKSRTFPGETYTYPIKPEELAELTKSSYWKSL